MADPQVTPTPKPESSPDPEAAAFDPNNPAVQEWFKSQTQGLVSNKEEILKEKKALEDNLKQLKSQWGDLDPKVVQNLVARMQNDEETKMIAEGKFDEVINKRVEAYQKDHDAKLTASQTKFEEESSKRTALENKIADLTIAGMVRDAASKQGLTPTAVEDAIFRAKTTFQLNENYEPVARNSDGTLLVGKDAKSPLSVVEWLDGMKEKAPHWFEGPSGGGTQRPQGRRQGAFTITSSEAENHQLWKARQAEAEKAGQQLQVVPG